MHPELEQLPQFRILEVRQGDPPTFRGAFDGAVAHSQGWVGCLVSGEDPPVFGRFTAFDAASSTAVFEPQPPGDARLVRKGMSCTYLDVYWGERAALVLDKSAQWTRTRFSCRDADVYRLGDTVITGPAGQAPPSAAWVYERTIRRHWDHEHCGICWQSISEEADDQPFGYQSTAGRWVCERCYSEYVGPRRLSFIDPQAVSQIRGERQSGQGPV